MKFASAIIVSGTDNRLDSGIGIDAKRTVRMVF